MSLNARMSLNFFLFLWCLLGEGRREKKIANFFFSHLPWCFSKLFHHNLIRRIYWKLCIEWIEVRIDDKIKSVNVIHENVKEGTER